MSVIARITPEGVTYGKAWTAFIYFELPLYSLNPIKNVHGIIEPWKKELIIPHFWRFKRFDTVASQDTLEEHIMHTWEVTRDDNALFCTAKTAQDILATLRRQPDAFYNPTTTHK